MKLIELFVDNRIRVRSACALSSDVIDDLKRAFTHENPSRSRAEALLKRMDKHAPARVKAIAYARLKSEPKFVTTWQDDAQGLSLPRGGLIRAREILERHGYQLSVVDRREEGAAHLRHSYTLNFETRDYQDLIVDEILDVEQGVVRSSTGSGKTRAMIAAAVSIGLPTLVVVHRQALLDQWVRELRRSLDIPENQIGVIGGGVYRLRPITVALQQSLRKRASLLAHIFGVVVADEVHLFAANTFVDVVDLFPARYRFGASDDERRKDGKEFLIHDVFGELIAKVDRQMLIEQGHVLDVEVRIFETSFAPSWWLRSSDVERSQRWGELIEQMALDDARNEQILDIASNELSSSERLLIWAHRRAHCEHLAALLNEGFTTGLMLGGKESEVAFNQALIGLLDGTSPAAVGTYQAIGPSLDVPAVARGIAATPIHTNLPFVRQVKGRLCRPAPNKTNAILYYPWDAACFGYAPIEALCRGTKSAKLRRGDIWVDAKDWLKSERARRRDEAHT